MHSINDAFDHSNHSCGQNNSSNKSQFIGKLHCLLIGNALCTRVVKWAENLNVLIAKLRSYLRNQIAIANSRYENSTFHRFRIFSQFRNSDVLENQIASCCDYDLR